ncbi:RNA chaperone Hfq [Halarsenatibacter silvermanii]|uniref:RNA-binding protein Hfq n=1 Tax=Halarsenatibacter silvermanii TaxID=321763 RepID=A0A1G9J7D9_9FIRM|nr:RNA chaperone Hfq [Halarsenatibacter silvermanii]SDL33477.1 RNA-binding protein Hfq [Halarsenatibacter silvermanii]
MAKNYNYQDRILNHVRKNDIKVTIYLISGYQLNGYVEGFDNFTIILRSSGKNKLIFKHAISTIDPSEPIKGAMPGEEE